MPLKGYTKTEGKEYSEQRKKLRQFLIKAREILVESNSQHGVGISYLGSEITEWEIDQTLFYDGLLSILSILVSFTYMAIHINSLLLALAGIFQILISLPA